MDVLKLKCEKCDYTKDMLHGTYNHLDSVSDVNEDSAFYKQSLGPVDKEMHSMDVFAQKFTGKCPNHDVDLEPIEDLPKKCSNHNGSSSTFSSAPGTLQPCYTRLTAGLHTPCIEKELSDGGIKKGNTHSDVSQIKKMIQ